MIFYYICFDDSWWSSPFFIVIYMIVINYDCLHSWWLPLFLIITELSQLSMRILFDIDDDCRRCLAFIAWLTFGNQKTVLPPTSKCRYPCNHLSLWSPEYTYIHLIIQNVLLSLRTYVVIRIISYRMLLLSIYLFKVTGTNCDLVVEENRPHINWMLQLPENTFLATLVALDFTPVTKSVAGQSFD